MLLRLKERIKIGGLMRCCMDTWDEHCEQDGPACVDGETLQCKYSSDPIHNMIRIAGIWKWNWPTNTTPHG